MDSLITTCLSKPFLKKLRALLEFSYFYTWLILSTFILQSQITMPAYRNSFPSAAAQHKQKACTLHGLKCHQLALNDTSCLFLFLEILAVVRQNYKRFSSRINIHQSNFEIVGWSVGSLAPKHCLKPLLSSYIANRKCDTSDAQSVCPWELHGTAKKAAKPHFGTCWCNAAHWITTLAGHLH